MAKYGHRSRHEEGLMTEDENKRGTAEDELGITWPKHNQEQEVVWARWQKKRTFVRALEGTYSHLTKDLLDQPRVYPSRGQPWKGGPVVYGKHIVSPAAT